jgi:hypothetical protein
METGMDFFTVPTAPDSLAQGNALGIKEKHTAALKGRDTERHAGHEGMGYFYDDFYWRARFLYRPYRAMFSITLLPRALPWANESGAVGTTEKLAFH